jgi:hypothetical protein
MGEMERTTQANARGAERLAAEATQLTKMAAKLDDSAARFHTLVFGSRARQAAAPMVGVAAMAPVVAAPVPAAPQAAGAAPAADPTPLPQQVPISRKDPRWRAA